MKTRKIEEHKFKKFKDLNPGDLFITVGEYEQKSNNLCIVVNNLCKYYETSNINAADVNTGSWIMVAPCQNIIQLEIYGANKDGTALLKEVK
jgi:hypothetical protein